MQAVFGYDGNRPAAVLVCGTVTLGMQSKLLMSIGERKDAG